MFAQLRNNLFHVSTYFASQMDKALEDHNIAPEILRLSEKKMPANFPPNLVSPMHPIATPAAYTLMQHIRGLGYCALAIKYPVVPKGMDRLRICLHGGNTEQEIDQFIDILIAWAKVVAANPPPEVASSSQAVAKL